jgi:hypothetical protein
MPRGAYFNGLFEEVVVGTVFDLIDGRMGLFERALAARNGNEQPVLPALAVVEREPPRLSDAAPIRLFWREEAQYLVRR